MKLPEIERRALRRLVKRYVTRLGRRLRAEPTLEQLMKSMRTIELTLGEQDGDRDLRTDAVAGLAEQRLIILHGTAYVTLLPLGLGYGLGMLAEEARQTLPCLTQGCFDAMEPAERLAMRKRCAGQVGSCTMLTAWIGQSLVDDRPAVESGSGPSPLPVPAPKRPTAAEATAEPEPSRELDCKDPPRRPEESSTETDGGQEPLLVRLFEMVEAIHSALPDLAREADLDDIPRVSWPASKVPWIGERAADSERRYDEMAVRITENINGQWMDKLDWWVREAMAAIGGLGTKD